MLDIPHTIFVRCNEKMRNGGQKNSNGTRANTRLLFFIFYKKVVLDRPKPCPDEIYESFSTTLLEISLKMSKIKKFAYFKKILLLKWAKNFKKV